MRLGVISLAILTCTPQLHAQTAEAPTAASPTAAAPSGTIARAHAAWDRGEFDVAETLYKEAIERGGLERSDLLDAYVHLGSARAVLGRKDLAVAAFRSASLIDSKFVTPPEAGRKAVSLADKGRREGAKIGAIELRMTVPASTPAAQAFRVDATLDAAHAAIVTHVGVEAREPVSGASFATTVPPSSEVHFEIPPKVALAESMVVVRTFALDGHGNKLAIVEQKLRVEAAPAAKAPPPIAHLVVVPPQAVTADKPPSKGFWSSPWPYVVGGVALAAGSAVLFLGTRPSDDVSIGAARVQAR